jgi:putative FmdB family regulatory protein
MPIYEYACPCGKTFEVLIIRQSDQAEVRCPACEGTQVERVISQTKRLHPGMHEYRWPDKSKVR